MPGRRVRHFSVPLFFCPVFRFVRGTYALGNPWSFRILVAAKGRAGSSVVSYLGFQFENASRLAASRRIVERPSSPANVGRAFGNLRRATSVGLVKTRPTLPCIRQSPEMTVDLSPDHSSRVCQARASQRCVSASGWRCSGHAVNNQKTSLRAQTHRASRLLDAPYPIVNNPG